MDTIDFVLYFSYALLGLAALSSILLPLINAASNPSTLIKPLIGIATLVVIFFVTYIMSSAEVTSTYTKFGVDAGMSKRIGGTLMMMYALLGISLVGIIFSEIHKMIK